MTGQLLIKYFASFELRLKNFGTSCLNEYLNETGLEDARVEMPRAHAVSAQINIRKALFRIKTQMRQNEWIVPTGLMRNGCYGN
jgi:hypothetical protein